ncbi:unnamed protein product [Parnassius apollo]|uniref:(apollo) hypothetical protein n=1 Tax=Parnassius apollo TaxID=110799 RepID=A0A8S3XLZ7_PARAO|nr:unnamed protein product [Parnassius apollo]
MYSTWRVCELKAELKKRGASLRGRKADLVESDDKKLDKAKSLYESRYLILARASTVGDSTFVKGYCKKTMRALQYEVDVKIHKNGTPQESHCECPAGSGIEAKCKHVAVLLTGIEHMVHHKIILLHQVSTQRLQTFHMPKTPFTASPIAAHKLPKKKKIVKSLVHTLFT